MPNSEVFEQLEVLVEAHRVIERVETRLLKPHTTSSCHLEQALGRSSEAYAAWESCQELRLQLAVSLLSIYGIHSAIGHPVDEKILAEPNSKWPVLNHSSGGIVFSQIDDHVVMTIPQPVNEEHTSRIIDGLFQILRDTPRSSHWLVDLSAVKNLPFRLLFTMLADFDSLAGSGRSFHLAWVRDGILPPAAFDRMTSVFGLTNRLGHWFSKFRVILN